MPYARTKGQRILDKERAERYEAEVDDAILLTTVTKFNSAEAIDIWHPGWYLEIKEKHQKISGRWNLPSEEHNCFIIDELSIRKHLRHYPEVFFLLVDRAGPQEVKYVVPIWELIGLPKERMNRRGPTGHDKGKWIVDLSGCLQIAHESDLDELLHDMMADTPWMKAECLGGLEVDQV